MKRFYLSLVFLLLSLTALAQSISVKSFQALPTDLTASSLEGKRIDQNGKVAALIKMVTPEMDLAFEGGTLGIVDTQERLPQGLRKITILHRQGVLRDYLFPTAIEAERTYEMVLEIAPSGSGARPKSQIEQQFLVFQITPPNATLEVNDKLWTVESDGIAIQYVNFGDYTYRVRAANYFPEAGRVTVDDPENSTIVKVNLKSDFAEVTFKVDADAEIWVNNEKKGVRTWTGQLGEGTYKIECRQAGHRSTMVSKTITKQMTGQTVTLEAPTPVYGSLVVESVPAFCVLFIDGNEYGNTPKSINEILTGKHVVKLIKDGFQVYTDTVTVSEGEQQHLKAVLKEELMDQGSDDNGSSLGHSLTGLFTVSANRVVCFSQGNLQYRASTDTWRFANKQYEVIGMDNEYISSNYTGWIDLLGWGTSGYNGEFPYMTSNASTDYGNGDSDIAGTNFDWGLNNKVSNGGNKPGLWRTLSKDEWKYLLEKRNTNSGIRYAKACVNQVNGLILLPDDWNSSTFTLKETNKANAAFSHNIITAMQWIVLEQHGAVFLPASGYRNGASISAVGMRGYYWSSSRYDSRDAYDLCFDNQYLSPNRNEGRYYGQSVRLVRDVQLMR